MSKISGYPVNNRDQKIWLLKEMKLGVWDVVKSCLRENSLDSNLRDIELNDIEALLKKYPKIKKIAFTGHLAERLFNREFKNLDIERVYLPSPSPANAKISFEEKCKIYRERLL